MLRSKSKDRAADGTGLFMSKSQMGDYLNDLRNNRPSRPTGARPLPSSFISKRVSTSNLSTAPTGIDQFKQDALLEGTADVPPRCSSAQSFSRPSAISLQESRKPSNVSMASSFNAGRPLARPPSELRIATQPEDTIEEDLPYLERGERWLERQEAHSLRRALEDMDTKDENKVFDDAQKEAVELVWRHQNPNAPYPNPNAAYKNPDTRRGMHPDYKGHLRKESIHTRTASWAQAAQDIQAKQSKRRSRDSSASRSVSGGSKSSSAPSTRIPSDSSLKVPESPTTPADDIESIDGDRLPRKRAVQFVEPGSGAIPDPESEPQRHGLRKLIRSRTPSPSKALQSANEGRSSDSGHVRIPSISAAAKIASNAVPGHFRNPFSRARQSKGVLGRVSTEPMPSTKPLERVEIQRNPPTQSRNPLYTVNDRGPKVEVEAEEIKMKDGKEIRGDDILKATKMSLKDRSAKLPMPTMVSDAPGRPIVSFQRDWKPKEVQLQQEVSKIEAAPVVNGKECHQGTSPKDKPAAISSSATARPTPALRRTPKPAVSMEVPGRDRERASPPPAPAPLVHAESEPIMQTSRHGPMPAIPTIAVSSSPPVPVIAISNAPRPIPTIAVNDAPPPIPVITVSDSQARPSNAQPSPRPIPSIAVSTPSVSVSPPSINVNGSSAPIRPLPTPSAANRRPLPHHSATAPAGSSNRSHFTPSGFTKSRGTGALCANCALPIAGRIVSAAGVRFHPECFRCHYCAEGLECVAFYPEPESFRFDRVNRIRDRMAGQYVEDMPGDHGRPGISEAEDGDETLRFYCHLDYHEFFSPRCKSCKTPIEGEVVVACGAEWHVGHFFCAQCGDPFDAKTPFVEKDGYAWCVNCHTNRYSTKCKRCRKPVTDTVVKALEAEWHEACFCCTECGGRFADGRYFIRPGGTDPFCPACEERRLKA